jgi:hypothetical protein
MIGTYTNKYKTFTMPVSAIHDKNKNQRAFEYYSRSTKPHSEFAESDGDIKWAAIIRRRLPKQLRVLPRGVAFAAAKLHFQRHTRRSTEVGCLEHGIACRENMSTSLFLGSDATSYNDIRLKTIRLSDDQISVQ